MAALSLTTSEGLRPLPGLLECYRLISRGWRQTRPSSAAGTTITRIMSEIEFLSITRASTSCRDRSIGTDCSLPNTPIPSAHLVSCAEESK
jgi:hypothetical protein